MKISNINTTIPSFKARIKNEKLIEPYLKKEEMDGLKENISKLGTENDVVEFSRIRDIDYNVAAITMNLNIKGRRFDVTSAIYTSSNFSHDTSASITNIERKITSAFQKVYNETQQKDIKNKVQNEIKSEEKQETLVKSSQIAKQQREIPVIQLQKAKTVEKKQINENETENNSTLTSALSQQKNKAKKLNNKKANPFAPEVQNKDNAKEIESLIDKKIEEKLKSLKKEEKPLTRNDLDALIEKKIELQLRVLKKNDEKSLTQNDVENIIDKKLAEKLKSDKNVKYLIREIIKDSSEEIARAITNYANDKYNKQEYSDAFRVALNRYLELLGPNYCG